MTKPQPIRRLIDTLKRPAPPEDFSSHHGFPMPRLDGGKLHLAVLSCPCQTRPTGLVLDEPVSLAIFDPTDGTRVELRDATEAELGGPVGHDRSLGVDRLAPGQSQAAFVRDQEALFTAFDVLLPLFAEGRAKLTREQASAAATFQRVFPTVTESVLAPYYRHVGKAWFDWLGRVAA